MVTDPDRTLDHLTAFLADRREAAGTAGYVVGVSGGVDSAVTLSLAVRAVGSDRVRGLLLPAAPSDEANVADARALCDDLDVDRREVTIDPAVGVVRSTYGTEDLDRVTAGNLQARLRAVYLYLAANREDRLVLGATNRSEYLLGYYTKHGDGAADVRVLGDHYKTEVYDLARALDLDDFAEKEPSAELWESQTDAGELGATYETIDPILRSLVDEGRSVAATAARVDADETTVNRFASMVEDTEHKRSSPPTPGRV